MGEHYFTATPASEHQERLIEARLLGRDMKFYTDAGVFSRDGVDPGSRLLLESVGALRGRVLDLGCGWGPVGLSLALENPNAHFVLADINERAVALSEKNARLNGVANVEILRSDGYELVEGMFDCVLSNPPIRAGKQVIYGLFDESYARLNAGGALVIVIRKQQGAPSALRHLQEVFGEAEVIARGGGYWIIQAIKRQ